MNTGRYCTKFAACLTAIVFLFPIGMSAQGSEHGVRSADIDARLQSDGTLQVTEVLQYDLGEMPQTGFVRRLNAPANGVIDIDSVYRDGLKDDYRTTQAGRTKRVIIGTEGVEITGEHNYQISYTIQNTLRSGNGTAQLSWPVVENAGIAAENITINLSSPLEIERVSCRIEPDQQGCPVTKVETGYQARLDELPAGKSLTMQADIPADQVTTDISASNSNTGWSMWSLFGVIAAILSIVSVYTYKRQSDNNNNKEEPVPDRIDSLS